MPATTKIAALFCLVTLGACTSSAALVRKDTLGGTVALRGAYMPAVAAAKLEMAEHCAGRYTAVEQRDTIVFQCNDAGSALAIRAAHASF